MRNILIVGYYFFCWISTTFVSAQIQSGIQNQYKFRYLTIDQGLSNNNIRSICQDSKGFIWFATQNGINKYNGQTIITYWNNKNDSTTISSNIVNAVFLDSKNNLWIGGDGGLDMYNADLDNFTRFKHKDITWIIEQIYTITEDQNQKLWFAGFSGVYIFDLNTSELQYFSNQPDNQHGIPPNQIYKILIDKNNTVWISVINEGIYVYNPEDSTYTIFKNDPDDPSSLSGNRVEKLYEDSKGNIWAGTLNEGLDLYIPESKSFKRYIPDPENTYSTRVRAIFEDLKGNFFVGTRAGLYILDTLTQKFRIYASEGHNFSKLSQNSIIESFIDKTGTLWIGTFAGGVNYTYLNKKEFTHYRAGKDDNHFLSESNIYAFTEDAKGNLWIGGDDGLNYLDRNTYTFKYFKNDPTNPNSLNYNDIKSLEWDKKGNLWIGTNRGGLNYYDIKSGKFKSYKHDPNNPNSIIGDKVYCLMNDKYNNLWIIANPDNEFLYLNIDILPDGQNKFIHLKETSYFGFEENKYGDVYIGGVNGFWVFNRKDSIFNFIANENYIGIVNTLRLDSRNLLWIGGNKGLTRYNFTDQTFTQYSKETGYPISEVYGILEDKSFNLWVSSNSGLLKISNIVNDTANIKIRIFDQHDGLQSKQFNYNAFYKCRSGEMVFGGINGFNTFFPEKIIENKVPANVVITDLKIFNKSVQIGEKIIDRIILKKSISFTNDITLGPHQNIFTLELATLQNSNPEQYVFKTKLEGLDNDWQYRKSTNNLITYTNLSPGKYTFHAAVANSDGFWNDNPVKLNINIIPPFWRTWWFILISIIIIITAVIGIYYYRIRSIRIQNLILEKTVKKRTIEITQKNQMLNEANVLLQEKKEEILSQKEEIERHRNNLEELVHKRTFELEQALEKAKESDALKSAFLANMSHEIRTPMNAIIGFTNLLSETEFTEKERERFVQIIQSNSNSLLKIIDEILDLSLLESNQLKIVNEVFDLNTVIDQLFSYYFLNNSNTNIEFRKNNSVEDQNIKINSDSVRIKQIITNLMDNACKFTKEGYIELGVDIKNEILCIYVKDSGKGIPSNQTNRIFQQFNKIEDEDFGWTRGLGLGLSISQKIADALGGQISVESSEGKGSTFTFNIPIKNIITDDNIPVIDLKEPVKGKWQDKIILIAEDVEANFLYLKNLLRKTKIKIIWAKDGEEAFQIATSSTKIDLILMDIKMPGINGYEAAKKIKELIPDQKIVAQTAYARVEEKFKFYDENFDEYLAKPIDPSNLVMILEKFL